MKKDIEKISDKTRIHQTGKIIAWADRCPSFVKNTKIRCVKKLIDDLSITEGKEYLTREDSVLLLVSESEPPEEYVMVTNDKETWGIYLAEMFVKI